MCHKPAQEGLLLMLLLLCRACCCSSCCCYCAGCQAQPHVPQASPSSGCSRMDIVLFIESNDRRADDKAAACTRTCSEFQTVRPLDLQRSLILMALVKWVFWSRDWKSRDPTLHLFPTKPRSVLPAAWPNMQTDQELQFNVVYCMYSSFSGMYDAGACLPLDSRG
jgi:hypothetical protein